MPAYYILRASANREHVRILGDPVGLAECHLEGMGVSLATALKPGVFYRKHADWGNEYTDVLSHPAYSLVVSAKALDVLKREPIQFETYSVPIKDERKGTTTDGYTLFHLLGTVDCVD